jgi:inner membrane protein
VRRGTTFDSGLPMRFGWLLGLSYIGAVTHPLLDLQNTYAVQLLSPLSEAWFHNDALFIIDVWLWMALAAGIAVSRRREAAGRRWQAPAQAALAGLVAYVALNAGLSQMAKTQLAATGLAVRPDAVFATQQPFLFWKRELIWRSAGMVARARFDLVRGVHAAEPAIPDNMTLPLALRARTNATARDFLRWSVLPIATIRETACRATVSFGDARFGDPRVSARFLTSVDLPLDRVGCR